MVAMALVSIALSGYLEARRLKQRHYEYLARAERHEKIAEYYRRRARPAGEVIHANLARFYAGAASRPWSPVGTEIPGPK
jgi:hypothetical protein